MSSLIVASASSNGPIVVVGLDRVQASAIASDLEQVAGMTPGEGT